MAPIRGAWSLPAPEPNLLGGGDSAQSHAGAIAASATDLVFQTNPHGIIVWVSDSVTAALGWSPTELVGTKSTGIIHSDHHEAVQARGTNAYANSDRATLQSKPHLTRYLAKSGEFRWFRTHLTWTPNGEGLAGGLIISAHDVHEEVMVGKALDVLSVGNRQLVQAVSEDGLLQRMCEIIVESGGYVFCWYGKLVPGDENLLQVLAHAGDDLGARSRMAFDAGFLPVSAGPVGRALRTQTVQTSGDFMAEPGMSAWAESLGRLAIQSAVCLPVIVAGKMDGLLTVYGTEVREFDARANDLLADLAADLGYGLGRLRDQAKLETAWASSVDLLAAAVEARDPYTFGHQSNVSALAVRLGEELGVPADTLKGLGLAAHIHDIGKIAIPLDFLSTTETLTAEQMEIMRSHSSIGWEITKRYPWPWPIAEIIHQHHERLDGSGYPRGLRGSEILLEAQLVAVADVYDAISHRRTYHEALRQEEAVEMIVEGRGTLFNPDVVDALESVLATGFVGPTS